MKSLTTKIGLALSLFTFAVYAYTSCPSIDVIDAGELATVAYTFGIAHPTGYAMFTLLSGLLSHLPIPIRIIQITNLTAGLFCAVSVFFFFHALVFLLKEFTLAEAERSEEGGKDELRTILIPAATGTLILAFSTVFWAQATSVEVYSLHVAFLALLLWIFPRAIARETDTDGLRYWLLFSFVLGLSFTNHMTTILLAPGFIFAFIYRYRFTPEALKRIALAAPFFLLGLSAYGYLPVRAGSSPVMNWGNPVTLDRLLWHFTGKQYRVWLFSSTESASRQMQYFIDTLPAVFVWFPLALAAIGIVKLLRERRIVLAYTALLFVGCVLYSINYDIHDIDSYFLLAYFVVAIWAAFGVAWLGENLNIATKAFAAGATVLCFIPLTVNMHAENERDFRMVEEYSRDMFNSIEPNGIIISYQWDYFVSAANYLQMVEHVRPDVVVIDKELLRRSWYYHQLETRYPWLVGRSRAAIDALLKELYKFEHDLPYDPQTIERAYFLVIRSFVERNVADHPVYVTSEIEKQYLQGLNLFPAGLALHVAPQGGLKSFIAPEFHFTVPEKTSQYTDGMLQMYARANYNAAVYKNMLGQKDSARILVDRALALQPQMSEALSFREVLSR